MLGTELSTFSFTIFSFTISWPILSVNFLYEMFLLILSNLEIYLMGNVKYRKQVVVSSYLHLLIFYHLLSLPVDLRVHLPDTIHRDLSLVLLLSCLIYMSGPSLWSHGGICRYLPLFVFIGIICCWAVRILVLMSPVYVEPSFRLFGHIILPFFSSEVWKISTRL